ncbi:MAG: protein kinase [Deltaproteobacteria bacterium]|nr:protein kinase [Deltaproteobacteria bacterium]
MNAGLSNVAERDPDLPETIDRYECLKKIATGGMAEIFLAKQSGLEGFEKVVVLKRILKNLARDEEFVRMFLDEARIAAKLSHPNIVQIYDLGKADDSFYIAMEYVSGRNVQEIIEKERSRGSLIPVEHVCRMVAGICDGLYYAHTRKDYNGVALDIVHRDISPQNILVSFAGGIKVVDFGIAKASTQLAQTRAGVLKGKYAYMSPEQVKGNKIDARADIFALGLVMYEMLTFRRAFERESSLKTLKAIVQEKPLNPREVNPDIPMEVVKLLSKALEKSPDRRYKDAQEMQLALEDYLDSSARKSNNIRISRYLYEIFDDELSSKSGTMIVEGVGEIIVPTEGPLEPRIEEEIDSKTLSAALVVDPKANPGAGVPDPNALYADLEDDDDDDDLDEDEHTIPVYDLEKYEQERVAQHAGGHDDSEDPTQAGVSIADLPPPSALLHSASKDAAPYFDDDKTRALGDIPLDELPKKPTAPVGRPTNGMPSSWDADTNEHGNIENDVAAAAVGVASVTSDGATERAPVAPTGGEIAPGISPPTLTPDASPTAPPSMPPPPVAQDDDDDDDKGGVPIAALLGIVVIFGMFFLAAVGGVVVFFVLDDGGGSTAVIPTLTVQVDSTPNQARVLVDGEEKGKTPVIFQMKRGEKHEVEIVRSGYISAKTELDLTGDENYLLVKEDLKKE